MTRPSVLLADDHPIVRDGLQSLLNEEFTVVGTVGDGIALVEAAKALRPDVIVTDLAMPGLGGLDALRALGMLGLPSRVIVLTMHADAHLAVEAFRRGAWGYVLKTAAAEELTVAVRTVHGGRAYLTPHITKDVMTAMAATPAPAVATDGAAGSVSGASAGVASVVQGRPTVRQRQVLALIAEGKRMKEIAAILGMSVRTVESHKYEMMDSLGVRSTAELIQYALQHPELA
jgi:DNA-binding NarL/FixJ family response regulator